jgi:hypothetical protein
MWTHWIRPGIRSKWPAFCNCFRLQVPGHPSAWIR